MVLIMFCSTCYLELHLIITQHWMLLVIELSSLAVDSQRGHIGILTMLLFLCLTRGLKDLNCLTSMSHLSVIK